MNSVEPFATFFGWCTTINIGIILMGLALFAVAHEWAGNVTSKIFGITSEEAKVTFFRAFQQYRFAVVVLNVVPYLALKLMA